MRKNYWVCILAVVCCILTVGCGKKEEEGDIVIYYLNAEGNGLAGESYSWKSDQMADRVDEVLKKLRKPEDAVSCTSVLPSDVLVTDCTLEDNMLDLSFSQEYELLDRTAEVLLRAAVVKSLPQIDGVDLVQFHVGGELLQDGHGVPIGYMQGEDFVENTGALLEPDQKGEHKSPAKEDEKRVEE